MIIDAHIHIYDPARPEGVPWPRPEERLLYRTVLPDDYRQLAVPHGIHGALVVEASAWERDNQWVLDQMEGEPYMVGEIGNLKPGAPGFAELLTRLAGNPRFRGIRRPCPDGRAWLTAEYRRDLALLEDLGLTLDVMVHGDWAALDTLACAYPRLKMVVCHLGHPITDGGAPEAHWSAGIRAAAEHSHIYCKVSGIPESARVRPAPTACDYYTPTLDVVWDVFGSDRVVFGSNWPVCELAAPFADVLRIAREYADSRGVDAPGKLFARNGRQAYGWLTPQADALSTRVRVVQGDITSLEVDALVNAANSKLQGGGGVDGAIHRAAGPGLAAECALLGGCAPGQAKLTRGHNLSTRYIIHTVGPVWTDTNPADEDRVLASCYRSALSVAAERGFSTIAFPAISTGAFGFPDERAARIALDEIGRFLLGHPEPREVILVGYTRASYDKLQRAFLEAGGTAER